MLGFSLNKLIVLFLIIAAVWYGFRILARRGKPVERDREAGRLGRRAADEEEGTVHDMETCSLCGTFVPTEAARACGRDGCPYPA
jgi:hypothetical protein